ncbi:MAG: PAS domain S-box protein, partial [Deltaproteobacteria bacterium]|nr:PAS domain S-box protein [Deltaproteobacteria bacterium]
TGIYIFQDGEFVFVNDRFAKIHGYTIKELLGKNYATLFHHAECELLKKRGSQNPGGNFISQHCEIQSCRKDGKTIWCEIMITCIKYGERPATMGNVVDITERKQTVELLEESEEKYRTVLEGNPDPVVVYDMEGKVIYFNPSFTAVFGWTLEECLGKKMDNFVLKENWAETEMMIAKTLSGEGFSGIETRRYTKAGNIIDVSISAAVYRDSDGNLSGSVVNLRDITENKVIEAQLQQSQKMEAIGTLAGGIAHDFNNILFPMFGYLEMMLQDVPEDDPMNGYLEAVLNGAKRARDLVLQILTFSRQKGHELKTLKIHLVIKEALNLISSSLPSTIEINQDIKVDCGLVLADPTRIHQIIMNLCTNSYQAMEKTGGKLTVTLKEVSLAAEDLKGSEIIPGKYICLTVADNGPGMEQGIVDRIFDPYFTTKKDGKGTGLGLALVHGIVKSHGGHVSVLTDLGKGAKFQVYLPVIKEEKKTHEVKTDTIIQQGKERILLVDDQDVIVQMEKQMLERLGYHVTARTSSIDAVETFRLHPDKYDLVITDMTMPNLTGEQLAERIMKIRSDIPVILCTGFSEMMSQERAESLRIKGFLMKPVVMKDLSYMIRKVLESEMVDG